MSTIERNFGRVKWFNNKAGYGFITVIDGAKAGSDLFVHHSSIQIAVEQYKYLVQGEYVEFTLSSVASGDHESQAADITGIRRGLLMCETRQAALDYSQGPQKQEEEQQEDKEKPKAKYQKKVLTTATTTTAAAAATGPASGPEAGEAWTPVSKRSPRHDKDQFQGRGSQGGRGSKGGRGSQGTRGGRGPK
jgi:cold shock CspA family protein